MSNQAIDLRYHPTAPEKAKPAAAWTAPSIPRSDREKLERLVAREDLRDRQDSPDVVHVGWTIALADGRTLGEGDPITRQDVTPDEWARLVSEDAISSIDPGDAERKQVTPGDTHRAVKAFTGPAGMYGPGFTCGPDEFDVKAQPKREIPEERLLVHPPANMRTPAGYFVELVRPARVEAAIPAQDGAKRLADLEARGFVRRLTDEELAAAKSKQPAKGRK